MQRANHSQVDVFNFRTRNWHPIASATLAPTTNNEIQSIIRDCGHDKSIRVRGSGHSLNGNTLPEANEILLETTNLAWLEISDDRGVVAGAGSNLWAVQHLLDLNGMSLPIVNEGFPGPSVGGFINAGGFSSKSRWHGGFWENVTHIELVTGTGEIVRITRGHDDFRWIFGSMGQLGIITSVGLAVLSERPVVSFQYYGLREILDAHKVVVSACLEKGLSSIDASAYLHFLPRGQVLAAEEPPPYWYTLLLRKWDCKHGMRALGQLVEEFKTRIKDKLEYEYEISFVNFNPPLLMGADCSHVAVGVWLQPFSDDPLFHLDFERAFAAAVERNNFRRYIQIELPHSPQEYSRYFQASTYEEFTRIKLKYDPRQIFNRGSVFESFRPNQLAET